MAAITKDYTVSDDIRDLAADFIAWRDGLPRHGEAILARVAAFAPQMKTKRKARKSGRGTVPATNLTDAEIRRRLKFGA
jgi:hypothetical protein